MSDALELWPKDWVEKARRFAHAKHNAIGHVRKYSGAPYTTHLDAVAARVKARGGNEYAQAAAQLHDTLEDTQTTVRELVQRFPVQIVSLVIELTDVFTKAAYPHLNRAARKRQENLRLANITPTARMIKEEDIADNSADITEHDPNFAKIFLAEKAELLEMWRAKDEAKKNT